MLQSILRSSSFALLLVLLTHSAAASPLPQVVPEVTQAANESPSVSADQEKIENVDARTNAVVPEDYLELSQMAARVGTEPQPCTSCDLVPCGWCQEGCEGSSCTHESPIDKPGATSRNGCARNNAGQIPPSCRTEASTEAQTDAPTPHPSEAPTDAPTPHPSEAPTGAPTEAQTAAPTPPPTTIDCSGLTCPTVTTQEQCTTCCPHGSWLKLTTVVNSVPTITFTCTVTEEPTRTPTEAPTPSPSPTPTPTPTEAPTPDPTPDPTEAPTPDPTDAPSDAATAAPTPPPTEATSDCTSQQTRAACASCGGTFSAPHCVAPPSAPPSPTHQTAEQTYQAYQAYLNSGGELAQAASTSCPTLSDISDDVGADWTYTCTSCGGTWSPAECTGMTFDNSVLFGQGE